MFTNNLSSLPLYITVWKSLSCSVVILSGNYLKYKSSKVNRNLWNVSSLDRFFRKFHIDNIRHFRCYFIWNNRDYSSYLYHNKYYNKDTFKFSLVHFIQNENIKTNSKDAISEPCTFSIKLCMKNNFIIILSFCQTTELMG